MEKDQPNSFWSSTTFKTIAGSSGGIFGFTAGALFGTLIPIPVVGTTIGTAIGTILGAVIGGTVGSVSGVGIAYIAGSKTVKEPENKIVIETQIDKPEKLRKINEEELSKKSQFHEEMWICVDNMVYDVTDFVKSWKIKNNNEDDCPIEEFAGKKDGSGAIDNLTELEVLEIKKNLIGVLE